MMHDRFICKILKTTKSIRFIKKYYDLDKDWYDYIYFIAKNPNTPIEILEDIINNNIVYARSSLAANRDLPEYLLEKLSRDEHFYVRRGLIYNPKVTTKILKRLTKDEDSLNRGFAKEQLKIRKSQRHNSFKIKTIFNSTLGRYLKTFITYFSLFNK